MTTKEELQQQLARVRSELDALATQLAQITLYTSTDGDEYYAMLAHSLYASTFHDRERFVSEVTATLTTEWMKAATANTGPHAALFRRVVPDFAHRVAVKLDERWRGEQMLSSLFVDMNDFRPDIPFLAHLLALPANAVTRHLRGE